MTHFCNRGQIQSKLSKPSSFRDGDSLELSYSSNSSVDSSYISELAPAVFDNAMGGTAQVEHNEVECEISTDSDSLLHKESISEQVFDVSDCQNLESPVLESDVECSNGELIVLSPVYTFNLGNIIDEECNLDISSCAIKDTFDTLNCDTNHPSISTTACPEKYIAVDQRIAELYASESMIDAADFTQAGVFTSTSPFLEASMHEERYSSPIVSFQMMRPD